MSPTRRPVRKTAPKVAAGATHGVYRGHRDGWTLVDHYPRDAFPDPDVAAARAAASAASRQRFTREQIGRSDARFVAAPIPHTDCTTCGAPAGAGRHCTDHTPRESTA